MEAVSTTRGLALTRSETLTSALLAAAAAVAVALLAPPGGDAAAHLYRAELVRDGVWLWDELWFGGHYPLAAYSLLYYLPAALLGSEVVVVAAAVAAAALFAAIARDELGDDARWPARAFALFAAVPLFTGTYSYAAGFAAALGALRLLQLGRRGLAVAAALVTVAFSPLAFAFLCVALVAAAVARRRVDRAVALGIVAVAAVQLTVLVLFPSEGRYPFSPLSLGAALTASALGAALAFRSRRLPALGWLFVGWAAVCLAAFAVPSPLGDNLTRLRYVVFALVLLAAAAARFRPRWLALGAVAFALGYNVAPDLSALPKRVADAETAEASFWAPALAYVQGRAGPGERVEVVPTFGHWEGWFVPQAGLALARGWYRQIDLVENPELYREPLEPAAYRRWLDARAVRFVLLPDARLGPMRASNEAALLRSGRAGLAPVLRTRDWTVYEVPAAAPLVRGPGPVRVERLDHDAVAFVASSPGVHRLAARWSRHRRVAAGQACLAPGPAGETLVRVARPGRVELRPSLRRDASACR